MLARKALLLWTILSLTICCSYHYELSFYHKGYIPSLNSKLRFDGYYSNKKIPWYKQHFPNEHIDFYRDGFSRKKGGIWGIYKISRDTLTVEFLLRDMTLYYTSIDIYTIRKDTLIGVTAPSKRFWGKGKFRENLGDTLYFHASTDKPDSSKSYIRKIRKIK